MVDSAIKPKYPYAIPNPKDALAGEKVPLDLVPDSLRVLASLASLEGALKYGKYNYRARPVRISVYLSALERHAIRLNNGEWYDKRTKIPHISNMIKCIAIIGDAWLMGTLIDDRPPHNQGLLDFMDGMLPSMTHLRTIFKGHNPVQYTQQVLLRERGRERGKSKASGRRSGNNKLGHQVRGASNRTQNRRTKNSRRVRSVVTKRRNVSG